MGIQFEQVTYYYPTDNLGKHIGLDSMDLRLEAGSFTAVVGAPASGKSTFLQHCNGLLRAAAGKVHVFDQTITAQTKQKELHELRQRVGLVFQYPEQQLFEETVRADLAFGPRNFGATAEEADAAALRVAARMGLADELLASSPFELSSGQQRKVAIAAVLAAGPDLLLLDEPTAGLDGSSRTELLELLRHLCKQEGKTIVMVTHQLEEALPFIDAVALLEAGKTMYHGSPKGLLQQRDLLDNAGISVPPQLALLHAVSERMQVPLPNDIVSLLSPEAAAAWVREILNQEAGV